MTAYFAVNVQCAELAGPFDSEGEARRSGQALAFGQLVVVSGEDTSLVHLAALDLARFPTPSTSFRSRP